MGKSEVKDRKLKRKKPVKKIEKKNKEELENEEKDTKRKYLLLVLLLLVVLIIGSSYAIKPIRDKIEDIWINTFKVDTPTSPVIAGGSEEWSNKRVVYVKTDAKSYNGIEYYEYCTTKEKNSKKCSWTKTTTKNMSASTTGTYGVYFRGVSKKGKVGKVSNREEVYIDNESPIIEEIKVSSVTSNKIEIKVTSKDLHSGVEKILYKIGEEWKAGEETLKLENLKEKTSYKVEIKVKDKVGNIKEGNITVETLEKEEETPGEETPEEEELKAPTYKVSPSLTEWSSYKIVEIIYPSKVEREYSLDGGKTWKKYEGSVTFTKNGTIIGRSKQGKKIAAAEELEIKFIDNETPQIDLIDVPSEFYYQESYKLPSHVKFGVSGGESVCVVGEREYTNTKDMKLGKYVIECMAYGNNGLTAIARKEVEVKAKEEKEEVWDGWIILNLYYPDLSTERQWRLGDENEIREEDWKDYTGPITVKITDVENIYIKYIIDGKEIVIPPAGRLLVDIAPGKYELKKNETTTVKITYDESSEIKEYKINNGAWKKYTKEFTIIGNTLVEAREIKTEKIRDEEGNLLESRKIQGNDSIYVTLVNEEGEAVPVPSPTPSPSPSPSPSPTETTTPDPSETPSPSPTETVTPTPTETTEPTSTPTSSPTTSPSPTDNPEGEEPIEKPELPSTYLKGPNILHSSTDITSEVKIKVESEEEASSIYISIRDGSYQKYADEVTITKNCVIRAYYVRKSDGKVSDISTYYVQNIQTPSKPYVRIEATPSPYIKDSTQVEVSISGRDYDTLEYSMDGIKYERYSSVLTLKNPTTIYAKGTNSSGNTIEKLEITNIVDEETGYPVIPPRIENLSVHIMANPDYSEENKIAKKTLVTIEYDSKATRKTYKINGGEEQVYTSPFEIEENSLINAYAYKENGYGSTSKTIDFLVNGISSPKINPSDANNVPVSSLIVSIEYDRNASIKKYKLGSGEYKKYNGAFEVTENTTITAYNENILGDKAESSYTVENITKERPPLIIDYGKYFLLKLNYPKTSKESGREYKWKKAGEWKQYKEDGILLIKPEYREELLNSEGLKVKIKDENGNVIDFKGDYYIIDVPYQELSENIFMRWDTVKPSSPTYVIDPTEETKEVEVSIRYERVIQERYYKIIYEDKEESEWIKYSGPIKLKKNGTVYAKGYTESEIESEISKKEITNVDNESPVINLLGEFERPRNTYPVTVKVAENKTLEIVLWSKGTKDEEYFESEGEGLSNYGQVLIEENGTYTFYAKDKAGNKTILHKTITNIDKSKPNIVIKTSGKGPTTKAKIEIDYDNSETKEYKIGTSPWTAYTSSFDIDSYTIIKNRWQNAEGSFTITARGTSEAGNKAEVEEIIYVLDLDIMKSPVITAEEGGYPLITINGIIHHVITTITFDEREGLEHYYSLDDGEKWIPYRGAFYANSAKVLAKSVNPKSGLTSESSVNVNNPQDIMDRNAYDNAADTSVDVSSVSQTVRYQFQVSSEMSGRNIILDWNFDSTTGNKLNISYKDSSNRVLRRDEIKSRARTQDIINIPEKTVWMIFEYTRVDTTSNWGESKIWEIVPSVSLEAKKYYPKVTMKGLQVGYQEVIASVGGQIENVQYKINEESKWNSYQNNKLRLDYNETFMLNGKNRVTNESLYPVKYISKPIEDSFDNRKLTSSANVRVDIDPRLQGKKIQIKGTGKLANEATTVTAYAYDKNGSSLNNFSGVTPWDTCNAEKVGYCQFEMTIPENTEYLLLTNYKEIEVSFIVPEGIEDEYEEALKKYIVPNIILDNNNWSEKKTVTIDYGQTVLKNEYSLDLGKTWQRYTKPLSLSQPTIVLARIRDGYTYLTGSSYTITKIDNVEPTINLDAIPTFIEEGNEYSLPSSYKVGISGNAPVCKIGEEEYTTTKELKKGTYLVKCSIENKVGKKASVEKEIKVKVPFSNLISQRPFTTGYLGDKCATYDDGDDTFLTGECKQNYVWYSGKLWRVVSLNNIDESVKVITQWNQTATFYNNAITNTNFAKSHAEMWLNDTGEDGFLGNLYNYNDFIKIDSQWNATEINQSLGVITKPPKTTMVTNKVGLLNFYEYQTSYKGTAYYNGYLKNGLDWESLSPTINSSWEQMLYHVTSEGWNSKGYGTGGYGLRPVINFKGNIPIVSGDGTENNPYILKGDKQKPTSGESLNTRTSGEYINFGNGGRYRIVNIEEEKIKIVSAEPLKENGWYITKHFELNKTAYLYDPTATTNIGYYLNNDFLNPSNGYITGAEIEMLEPNQTWYLGAMDRGENYSKTKCNIPGINCVKNASSVKATVGMLRLGEQLAGQFSSGYLPATTKDYWLLTPHPGRLNYKLDNSGGIVSVYTYQNMGVRPSMYLKSNVIITGGSGTKQDPFTVSQ